MEANREEVDPSGQELIEGSTIAEEISSVNHTAPSSSAPPTEGIVNLSDPQTGRSAADKRYYEKKKRKKAELMEELGALEAYADELVRENDNLQERRREMEAMVKEEYHRILSQCEDNNAGQNTEVQEARTNFTGETSTSTSTSTGQDGLNEVREVNQASITSNADAISGENASMNLQTLPRPAQPAGSSGLPDDKQARKRVADKKYPADTISGENASMNLQTLPRPAQPAGSSGLPDDKKARQRVADKTCREKRKRTIDEAAETTRELKKQNAQLERDNAVLKAEANQLQKQLEQLRHIREKMNFKFFQMEKDFVDLTGAWIVDTCMAFPECHEPEIKSVPEPPPHD
ncbi:hypothetical protein IMY05_014G0038600 [Salix suchowensis]|nr:hypothetical protein IMY05_014G0038600 [Salix suchowensis]